MNILVLNSGSSSQKASLYALAGELPETPPLPLWEGKIEWRDDRAKFQVRTSSGAKAEKEIEWQGGPDATAQLLQALLSGETRVLALLSEIHVVGHRIVNGGPRFTRPAIVTPEVKAAIREMAKFAPLHNRIELEGIALIEKECGAVPQIAVFDTGFHSGLSDAAAIYPGPYEWAEHGIRKFGFHGISHEYCAGRAAQLLGRDIASLRLVTCHLGNGCSLAAVLNGKSIDTTMGFTPLDGLMMGTRSGAVDPGILTYLLRDGHTDGQTLDETLNTKSGLLGISGLSGDMREITTAMRRGHPRAQLAFQMFVHRLRSGIGSMITALEGADAIVFTGGIGENSAEVREGACVSFAFLSLGINTEKNAELQPDQDIATVASKIRVLVIRAQEDWAIARECWKLRQQTANTTSA